MYNIEENFTHYMKEIGTGILFSSVPGESIKGARKRVEVSQQGMARLLGVRRETISRIETGAINPTSTFIKSYSKMVAIIKVFRDLNALKDAKSEDAPLYFNPTFIRTHFALTTAELEALMDLGNTSYNKTKKKVLRRINI